MAEQEEQNSDLFVAFMLLGSLVVALFFAIFGAQKSDIPTLIMGILPFLFTILGLVSSYFSETSGLMSTTTFYQQAVVFLLTVLGVLLVSSASNYQFSFMASSTNSWYLSSMASQLEPAGQAIVNIGFATIQENFLIYMGTWLLFEEILVRRRGMKPATAALIAPIPAALVFMAIHGVKTVEFYLLAFALAMFMFVPIFLEKYADIDVIPYVKLGFSFGLGLHVGINMSKIGGFWEFRRLIYLADKPLIYASWVIDGVIWFIVLYVLFGTLKRLHARFTGGSSG